MTGTLVMYDSASNSQFPANADAYAAYVDGGIGDQPNYAYIVAAFPRARHLSIALSAGHDADCLDVEAGAASPADVAGWLTRQRKRGLTRPCLYASVSAMRDSILPLGRALGLSVRLWTAHYGAGEHVCGPRSCGLLPVDADGTQWTDRALGRDLDQSLLRGDFFGSLPVSTGVQWTEFDMARLRVLRHGDVDQGGEFFSVHRLQALLAVAGQLQGIAEAAGLRADGIFGPATARAVTAVERHYQKTFPAMIVDAPGQETAGTQVWGVLLTGSPG